MGVVVFFVLALLSAAFIVYPLLPGRQPVEEFAAVTDGEIEQAVRRFRGAPASDGLSCPTCGRTYKAGDSFCVSCGGTLPTTELDARVCPSCGAGLGEADQFCAKCGNKLAAREVA
jgi:hypothetical protein